MKYLQLYENYGISEDAKKLSEIIKSSIFELKYKNQILINNKALRELNIKLVIIKKNNIIGTAGVFEISKSKIDSDGAILFFQLSTNSKSSDILHECFHGMDFIYKKGKFDTKLINFINDNAIGDWQVFFKTNKFAKVLYYISDEEVKANLHSIYDLSKNFYNKLEITNEKKREDLIKFIKSQYEYEWYLKISNINIPELIDSISKNKIKGLAYAYYNKELWQIYLF